MTSEKQHILRFVENFIIPISELDYDSEVSFIDFLILDKRTGKIKICIEFKKYKATKEKMFEQLQNTKGIKDMTDYKGSYGAVNSTHFYIKDNDWKDLIEFDLEEVTRIQKWLRTNLIDEEVVDENYWQNIFEKCGFVLESAQENIFELSSNIINYTKVLAEKNKYIQELFSAFSCSFGGVNINLSFAEMFLNEIGISNSLPHYVRTDLQFRNIILEDGYKEYLQLHYQELIFDNQQRKKQGAFYTKLNVTGLMWKMIQKHINIEDYYIWDPCCGTGNLFKDLNNEVFDFIDKDRLYLSDIDLTAVNICKQDKGFNAHNVFDYNYQRTISNNFIDEQCFQFDYQNTIVDNFVGMPSKLQNVIKETPEKLFIVCNPPHLQLQGTNPASFYVPKTIVANEFRNYGVMAVADLYRQYMIWTNEQQIKKSKKCYIVPLNWTYARQTKEKRNSLNDFRKLINQNFFDSFIISNCEFENVGRYDPVGVFLVGNDKDEYSWKKLKIPVYYPEDEKNKAKFIKEMNKINAKYNLKKYLPKLQFKFEKEN